MVVTLVQLLQISILSRFLNPSAFGLMALVMVVIGFSKAFLDMGISNAIIHKQTITHEQLSTLYWVNVLTGFLLFAVVCVLAPFVAGFYQKPELTALTSIVGVTFLIQPFGQQFMALWQKEMRFAEMAKIDVVNKLVSLVVSVSLACRGYGVYALVYGTLAGVAVQTAQFLVYGLKEHKPSLIFRPGEIKEFIRFGAFQMGDRTVNYFNYQIDTMLIGKLLGAEALGIYSIAKQLIMRPAQVFNPIITKVTFPAMARIQDDPSRLKNIYLKTINYLSSVNFPVHAFIFVFAHDLVLVLFGAKWLAAVPVIRILSVWGAIRSTGNPIGSLLLAKGKVRLGFYWNVAILVYFPAGIYAGSHWGLLGVSWALIGLQLSLVVPNWYFLCEPLCGARFVEYHMVIFKPAIMAVVAGFGAYLSIVLFDTGIVKFLVGSIIGLFLTICLNCIWNAEFVNEFKKVGK